MSFFLFPIQTIEFKCGKLKFCASTKNINLHTIVNQPSFTFFYYIYQLCRRFSGRNANIKLSLVNNKQTGTLLKTLQNENTRKLLELHLQRNLPVMFRENK